MRVSNLHSCCFFAFFSVALLFNTVTAASEPPLRTYSLQKYAAQLPDRIILFMETVRKNYIGKYTSLNNELLYKDGLLKRPPPEVKPPAVRVSGIKNTDDFLVEIEGLDFEHCSLLLSRLKSKYNVSLLHAVNKTPLAKCSKRRGKWLFRTYMAQPNLITVKLRGLPVSLINRSKEDILGCRSVWPNGDGSSGSKKIKMAIDIINRYSAPISQALARFQQRGGRLLLCRKAPHTYYNDYKDQIEVTDNMAQSYDRETLTRVLLEEIAHSDRRISGWATPANLNKTDFIDKYSRQLIFMETEALFSAMQESEAIYDKSYQNNDTTLIPPLPGNVFSRQDYNQLINTWQALKQQANVTYEDKVNALVPFMQRLKTLDSQKGDIVTYKVYYQREAGRVWDCYAAQNTVVRRGRLMCKV